MSRWNEVITLLAEGEDTQDDEGTWHRGEPVRRVVFCNPMTIGTMTMAQLRSSELRITAGEGVPEVGLRAMAMVEVRSAEYRGEERVEYRGEEMRVIGITESGENARLFISRKLGNE